MPFMIDRIIHPARFPFFYGWVIVAVGTLGIAASIPGQTMGVSVFTPRLESALGMTSSRLSLAYGLGTVTSGLLLVRGGQWIDRFGVRRTMMMSSFCLGLSLILLSVCDRVVGALSAPFGDAVQAAAAMAVAMVAFFLIRFLGQGIMTMTSRVVIGKWFQDRRGLAVGVSGVLGAFSFGAAPWLLSTLIGQFGWRGAYVVLAGTVGLGMAGIAGLFYREQPEDFGLLKDGHPHRARSEAGESLRIVHEFTLSEARRSWAFWVFTLGLGAQGMIITAFTFHIVGIGAVFGLDETEAVRIFLPMSVVSVASNLTSGWISDYTKLKYLLSVEMVMLVVATLSVMAFGTMLGRAGVIVGFGMSGGVFASLVSTVWPRFFGTQHLGSISGQNMSIMVLMTAVGPLLFAESVRVTGGYAAGLIAAAAVPAIVLFASFTTGNPQDRLAASAHETETFAD